MRASRIDLYGVLGLARLASAAEVRRAYRQLALAHHPDRAGPGSAAKFAGIADAYRVLSDPVARVAYDASLAEQEAWDGRGGGGGGVVHAGGIDWTVSTNGWKASRSVAVANLLPRVSGRFDDLVAAHVASVDADGVMELTLNAGEAASGGTSAIKLRMKVTCSSCGGVARPRGVWCRTCQHEGRVVQEVTVYVRVEPRTRSGTLLATPVSGAVDSPLRVRFLVSRDEPVGRRQSAR